MNGRVLPVCAMLCLSLSASASDPPPTYAIAYWAGVAATADFNRDGHADIAVACDQTISVLLGNGDGTFEQPAVDSPSSAASTFLAVGDFDEDGDPDLVTLDAVLLANGDALERRAERVECVIDGRAWTQRPFPYQGKCLQWLRESRAALTAADRRAVDELIEGTGCEKLFVP